MGIFDDFNKEITDAANKIVSKTKRFKNDTISQTKAMSDINKLKSKRKDAEKNIVRFYMDLGKMYYQNSGNNCEDIYKSLVDNIKREEYELNNIELQIAAITGVKKCRNCNSKVPDGSVFCNICGSKLEPEKTAEPQSDEKAEEAQAAPAEKICEQCGKKLPDNGVFCTNCGKKYNS